MEHNISTEYYTLLYNSFVEFKKLHETNPNRIRFLWMSKKHNLENSPLPVRMKLRIGVDLIQCENKTVQEVMLILRFPADFNASSVSTD